MTAKAIKEHVEEALLIRRLVKDRLLRLEEIKATLVMVAMNEQLPRHATEGGGESVTLAGEECQCRITFPGPTLSASFKKTDDEYPKIRAAAGESFTSLFRPQTTIKPVPDFRPLAKQLLGDKAAALINLLEHESAPSVSFQAVETFEKDWLE